MLVIADILLVAGALGAGFYCYILSARLRRFTDLEKGVGGAVAVLSAQVDDLSKSLHAAQSTASGSMSSLSELNERAEASARRLELLLSSMHDLPTQPPRPSTPTPSNPFFVRRPEDQGAPR